MKLHAEILAEQFLKRGGGIGSGASGSLFRGVVAASTYSFGIGKGLSEPVAPYRTVSVFGADLGAPDANNWNAVPEIVDPTTAFDLSSITPNHEVVVALSAFYNVGSALVTHQWYRNRDNKKLFEFSLTIPNPASYGYSEWAWYYVYSYIGYVESEIWENGDYTVKLLWESSTLLTQLGFTVSGIAPTTPTISEFKILDFIKV